MANDRASRVISTDRVDLAELPLGSLVEIKTRNSTYWLTTLSTTIFSAGFAKGLLISSSGANNAWGNPRNVSTTQVKDVGDILPISNYQENLHVNTSRITSITIIQ
jgi:hypothetical protein